MGTRIWGSDYRRRLVDVFGRLDHVNAATGSLHLYSLPVRVKYVPLSRVGVRFSLDHYGYVWLHAPPQGHSVIN